MATANKLNLSDLEQELAQIRKENEELRDRNTKSENDRTNLQYLLYTTRELTEISSLNDMIQLVLERLYNTYRPWCFALVIENSSRPTVVEFMGFIGFSDEEKQKILEKHEVITNDIAESASDDDITFLFDDDDEDDSFLFAGEEKSEDGKDEKSQLVYGSDKAAMTELMGSADEPEYEWMVMPGDIGTENILKVFVKGNPIESDKLSTVRLFLSLVSALIHNHLLRSQLKRMANTDALTGLLNRGGIDAAFDRYKAMAKEAQSFVFSVIAIDVNGLKYVNDTYGHEAGDTLICNVAEILVKSTRKSDVISRCGGDEFVVICPNTDFERTKAIVERIRELEQETAVTYSAKDSDKEETIPVRMSLGVADSNEFPADKVLKEADHREALDKKEYYKTHKKYR
ncbi:MAG: GGDEF domain-containing protein [Pseudobacteriovorax sp.]|nr:GGDEF domain-containing protein [Pseudobacteriovorax sp.]